MQVDPHNSPSSFPSSASSTLFIFLGASNLARAYTALAGCLARTLYPHPVEFLSAMGPGRGYCAEGGLWNVVYPPIGSCGIFSVAQEKAGQGARVAALVTDLGNDIMYGVPADEIVACLNGIFKKLVAMDAEIFVTPIPVDLENDVGEFYFRCLRRIFYPRSPIGLSEAAAAVKQINLFLENSAGPRINLLRGMQEFRGVDKIHYSLLKSHNAWSRVTEEMCRVLNVERSGRIGWMSMAAALRANLFRLFFTDMLHFVKKEPNRF